MTTKTNITLPPLPEWSKMDDLGGLVPSEVRVALAGYARAAVEADRQGRMPSDDEIIAEFANAQTSDGNADNAWTLYPDELIQAVRTLLSRYSSGQPAEPMKQLYAQSATLGEYGIIPECDTQPAASVEPRPDEYDYFVDWYDEEAPDENEVRNFDMARYAWLAGVRFADRFPVAACAAREKA